MNFPFNVTNDSLTTNIFRKKTCIGLLTNYFSFTSYTYKIGLIRTLCDRLYKLNNTWSRITTLKEETFSEETFAISRFFAKLAKVCSGEIYIIYINRETFVIRESSFSQKKSDWEFGNRNTFDALKRTWTNISELFC